MARLLLEIVEQVRRDAPDLPNVALARLNLLVGKPLSRQAAMLADDPALVHAAREAARQIIGKRAP